MCGLRGRWIIEMMKRFYEYFERNGIKRNEMLDDEKKHENNERLNRRTDTEVLINLYKAKLRGYGSKVQILNCTFNTWWRKDPNESTTTQFAITSKWNIPFQSNPLLCVYYNTNILLPMKFLEIVSRSKKKNFVTKIICFNFFPILQSLFFVFIIIK